MKPTVLILRHMPQEAAGTLETALTRAGLTFQYVDLFPKTPDGLFDVDWNKNLPDRLPLDRAAGLVVLGGPMNVDEVDRYPFLKLDVQWIQEALERRLPLLGVCLGSQLLAKALGARVYPNRVKEIGWHRIELLPAAIGDSLFARAGRVTVFQWHGDTFDLPNGAVLLAEGAECRHQAFRWGSSAYGLQFHIEMTAPMIEDWLSSPSNQAELAALDEIDPAEKIRRQTPARLPALQSMASEVFARFARMCREFYRP